MHLDGALDLEELPLVKVPSGQAKAVADIILRQMEIVHAPDKAAAPEAAPAKGEMVR